MRSLPSIAGSVALFGALMGCGGRTGLLTAEDLSRGGPDFDGGPVDGAPSRALPDAPEALDALPTIDVGTQAAPPAGCTDPAATLVYVVTEGANLLSFDPTTDTFQSIGALDCSATGLCLDQNGSPIPPTPYSMAVNKAGTAYVVYCDGELFEVSTQTASCSPTAFAPGQAGFSTAFGMGFAQNDVDPGETLYVASDDPDHPSLGIIDVSTFTLSVVGPFAPPLFRSELSGSGTGSLFGFYSLGLDAGTSAIGEIDKRSGRLVAQSRPLDLDQGTAWAFAFWGGDFYTFTSPAGIGASLVHRYRPSDGSLVQVSEARQRIVGAGVSPCAPVR